MLDDCKTEGIRVIDRQVRERYNPPQIHEAERAARVKLYRRNVQEHRDITHIPGSVRLVGI